MPADLLDDLRAAAGPDRAPSPEARAAGLAALQRAIEAELAPPGRRRRRPLLLAASTLSAAALAAVAVALVPGGSPGAAQVLERAAAAVAATDGAIVYMEGRAWMEAAGGERTDFGIRRVWLRAGEPPLMRWLQVDGPNAGAQDVSGPDGTTRFDPKTGSVTVKRGTQMVPGELMRARGLVERAPDGARLDEVELAGRPAFRLRWEEPSPPGHRVEMTLWVDRETYEPLQFTDRGVGRNEKGAYDQTFTEVVTDFAQLPDTPANRKLLQLDRG